MKKLMNKFTFTCTQSYEGQPATSVTVETDAEQLADVIEAFTQFLRGCGFQVNDGEISYQKKDDHA